MKKKHLFLAAFLAANIMTGQAAFAAEEDAEPEEIVAEATGEAPADTNAAAMGEDVGMANPMFEYPDVPSLERAVGFPVYYLPGNLLPLYHPAAHIYSIDRYVSDIRFQSIADDSKITVSGYYGEWTQQSAGDVKRTQVYVAQTATGMHVVRWSAGRFTFAITVEGVDDNTFRNMLKNFVSVADRFAHKYRNFRLNYKPKKQSEQPAGAAQDTPAASENPAS